MTPVLTWSPKACPDCNKVFFTEAGLEAHRKSQHSAVAKQRQAVAEAKPRATSHRKKQTSLVQPSAATIAFAHRHNNRCYWCGRQVVTTRGTHHPLAPTREHLLPRVIGGEGGDNLVLAHKVCNEVRGRAVAEAFRAFVRGEHVTASQLWPWLFEGEETTP